LSLSASVEPEREPAGSTLLLRYFDVALVVVAAPILLLIGVSAVGYLVGAGTWVALRALGEVVERSAVRVPQAGQQISIRLGYLLGRLFALAIAVILVRQGSGRDAGLTTLLVIVAAFTIQLALGFANRPRSR
jgi:hypothetical protein